MNYKIHIDNRNYETWNLYNIKTMEKIEKNVSPIKEKLFHNDIFTFDMSTKSINISYSGSYIGTINTQEDKYNKQSAMLLNYPVFMNTKFIVKICTILLQNLKRKQKKN